MKVVEVLQTREWDDFLRMVRFSKMGFFRAKQNECCY
jgi:hypothetical protein